MKRCLWLCVVFLLAGHIPVASADAACEGRFVNPITDICWSCIFPLSLGSTKVSQGKVPDTANPSMPQVGSISEIYPISISPPIRHPADVIMFSQYVTGYLYQ